VVFCDYLIIKLLLIYRLKENSRLDYNKIVRLPFPHEISNFLPFFHKIFTLFHLSLKFSRKQVFYVYIPFPGKTKVSGYKR